MKIQQDNQELISKQDAFKKLYEKLSELDMSKEEDYREYHKFANKMALLLDKREDKNNE